MTITNRDQFMDALLNNTQRIIIDKASLTGQVAGGFTSLWRATGQPGQGGIPVAPAVCNNTTPGGINITNATAPAVNYFGLLALASGNNTQSWEIHDRLLNVGQYVLNATSLQAVSGMDLSLFSSDLSGRWGDSNYSDVQWWLEVYTAGGATASNATINVTYHDGSSGNLTAVAVGGTLQAGRMIPLTPLIPAADQGKFIRAVNNMTLSASTGTAGSVGFTATRVRTTGSTNVANKTEVYNWADNGSPVILPGSCLQLITLNSTTSSGTLRGTGKAITG